MDFMPVSSDFHWLHQLNSIAEGVFSVHPVIAFKRLIGNDSVAGGTETLHEVVKVIHDECRMCLSGGREIGLDAQVNLQIAMLEPATPPCCQVSRFYDFWNAEKLLIKCSRLFFAPSGHCKLNVIQAANVHTEAAHGLGRASVLYRLMASRVARFTFSGAPLHCLALGRDGHRIGSD